jgi:hypothetical protein
VGESSDGVVDVCLCGGVDCSLYEQGMEGCGDFYNGKG